MRALTFRFTLVFLFQMIGMIKTKRDEKGQL